MSVPKPSGRLVALMVGVALVVVGAVLAAYAAFGGSDGSSPSPGPSPSASCNIFDPECAPGGDSGGGDPTPTPSDPGPTQCRGARADVGDDAPMETTAPNSTKEPTAEPTTPPCGGTGGSGNGGLFGGTG
ncbi:hypothetical protein [Streptomyces sp. NPDC053427]|uniref:hypothetical protein n=1 Tax=Streptomyces sp. NPDC053427 TaxID=3365701 RepID=UPI0037D1A455